MNIQSAASSVQFAGLLGKAKEKAAAAKEKAAAARDKALTPFMADITTVMAGEPHHAGTRDQWLSLIPPLATTASIITGDVPSALHYARVVDTNVQTTRENYPNPKR